MAELEKNPYILGIQKIVDTAVRVPKYSYPMYQNAPRPPSEKFAAIRFVSSRNPGYDNIIHYTSVNGELMQKTEGVREIMFDILFNRDDTDVVRFDNSFFRPDIQQVCHEVNLELLRKKPTDLRTRSLETNWEIRTGITCIFSAIVTDEVVIGYVDEANMNGTFIDDKGNAIEIPIIVKEN